MVLCCQARSIFSCSRGVSDAKIGEVSLILPKFRWELYGGSALCIYIYIYIYIHVFESGGDCGRTCAMTEGMFSFIFIHVHAPVVNNGGSLPPPAAPFLRVKSLSGQWTLHERLADARGEGYELVAGTACCCRCHCPPRVVSDGAGLELFGGSPREQLEGVFESFDRMGGFMVLRVAFVDPLTCAFSLSLVHPSILSLKRVLVVDIFVKFVKYSARFVLFLLLSFGSSSSALDRMRGTGCCDIESAVFCRNDRHP